MKSTNKNIIGLLVGVLGLAAIKKTTGSRSIQSHQLWAEANSCLESANGNIHEAKSICRKRHAGKQDIIQMICDTIDGIASGQHPYSRQSGSRAIKAGTDGKFTQQQDNAFFRFMEQGPTKNLARPRGSTETFDERIAELQGQMQSNRQRREELNSSMSGRAKSQIQSQLDAAKLEIDRISTEYNAAMLSGDEEYIEDIYNDLQAAEAQAVRIQEQLNTVKTPAEIDAIKDQIAKLQLRNKGLTRALSTVSTNKTKFQSDFAEWETNNGKPVTLEQYAEAEYQRGASPQFRARYIGEDSPGQKAWKQHNERMASYAGNQSGFKAESADSSFGSDFGDDFTADFESGFSEGDKSSFSDEFGFDIPKIR
jgi:hypothetical protein